MCGDTDRAEERKKDGCPGHLSLDKDAVQGPTDAGENAGNRTDHEARGSPPRVCGDITRDVLP